LKLAASLLYLIRRTWHPSTTIFAAIEKVGSMPGQGVASTFSFGESYGKFEGILMAVNARWIKVVPGVWQKAILDFSPKKTGNKQTDKALRKAGITDFVVRTCGDEVVKRYLSPKKNQGAADAYCLALYAASYFRGVDHGKDS
jgi:crossover junction endodeoxyribonuclease RuvC